MLLFEMRLRLTAESTGQASRKGQQWQARPIREPVPWQNAYHLPDLLQTDPLSPVDLPPEFLMQMYVMQIHKKNDKKKHKKFIHTAPHPTVGGGL